MQGLKYLFFNTAQCDLGRKAALLKVSVGNAENFTMNPALPSARFEIVSVSFSSEMFIFFDVEDNGILIEYAYSFLRLIFNTAQLRFYYCPL